MCRRVQGEQVLCLLPLCWLSHEISPRSLTHRPRLGPPVESDSQPSNSEPRGVSLSSSAPVTGTGGLWSAYRPRPRLAFTQVIGPTTGGGQLSSPLDYAKSADAITAGSLARCWGPNRRHVLTCIGRRQRQRSTFVSIPVRLTRWDESLRPPTGKMT